MPKEEVELHFELPVVDEWPPVSVEGLIFEPIDGGYKLAKPPLFVKGLSVGDEILVDTDCDQRVVDWQHRVLSKNSTVWVLRIGAGEGIENVVAELISAGCDIVKLPSLGSYSVNVPDACSITVIDEILDKLDRSVYAVAYPSFRHEEYDSESDD